METGSFDQLERLFRAARVLSGDEQSAFIKAACVNDDALRAELESLLASDAEAEDDSFLSTPADIALDVLKQTDPLQGQTIGPYKFIELLAEGGMGEVWLGEQKTPIKREVAIKVVKLGMDTKEIVARFESERQALAVMSHPNIARVFGAGIMENGRPYFVMELVRGVPVNQYCDQHKLSTTARIELFMDICNAVQHAHQKGIIHRDLKPSNILVTEHDDKPLPKVIDFGIAKAIGYNLTTSTLVTSMGQIVGTPAYMSPEQALQSGLDVDTRTDVYSLGVMLYELLVGTKPIDFKAKAQQAIHEAIRDSLVQKPSTRLTSLGVQQKTIAEFRQTTPERLRKELAGDLDWIVLKSIEKDRSRRYETVNGLKLELKRYLTNEPVIARPPSMGYRLQKLVQRNKTMVAAASIVFLTLCGGIAAASVGLVRAQRAEQVAQNEAMTANEVSDFLINLFEVSDPGVARGNSITAREILDQGAERIETGLKDQPAVRAKLLHTIGQVYWELGIEDQASENLQEAVKLKREVFGENHPEVAKSLRELAHVKGRHFGGIEKTRREEILELFRQSKAIHEQRFGLRSPQVAQDLLFISRYILDRLPREDFADYQSAIAAAEEALSIYEEVYGPEDIRIANVLYRLGTLYRDGREDFEQAGALFLKAADIIEQNKGPEAGELLEPLFGLYVIEYNKNIRSASSLEVFKRLWTISDEALINSDANISLYITLSTLLQQAGAPEEAEASLERVARILEKKYGPDVEDMVFAHMRLVQLYVARERWREAEEKALWMIPIWEQNDNRHNKGNAFYYAGIAQSAMGRFDEAEKNLLEALSIYEQTSTRYDLTTTLWEVGRLQRITGRLVEAEVTEEKMRAAAQASASASGARDSDWRFYALALLNCRELWKIRTPRFECYGEPFDAETALEYAQKAIELRDDLKHNRAVLAIAQFFSGDAASARKTMASAIELVHENDPTIRNLRYWMERFEAGANA